MINNLAPLARFWRRKNVNIYDTVFKLHSKATVCFLFACVVFLSANEYFRVRIDCVDSTGKHKQQLDNYCWMMGTYINQKHFNGTIGTYMINYGVGPKHVAEQDRDYQKYYQWVSIFLTIHTLLFCIPAYCWKVWERRTLERLIGGLSDEFFVQSAKEENLQNLYNFFLHSHYRIRHRIYAIRYFLAEVLNLITVGVNILLLNVFLSGFWFDFWPAIQILFEFNYDGWLEATAHVFPRVAKCEYFFGGPSGGIQNIDALCLLPLNVLNEKIYTAIYLWLVVLFVISALNIAWKLLLICSCSLRMLIIRAEYREVPSYQWDGALDGGRYSQWFLFRHIAKNLSTSIVHTLADRLCHTAREEYYIN